MTERPRASSMRLLLALTLLVLYAAIVAAMTLSPTPLDRGFESSITRFLGVLHRNGVPEWFGYHKLEFTANVLMFIPLGFLFGLALPRRIWWLALLICPALSIAIELSQAAFLSARIASPTDVISNSIGGVIGITIAVILRAMVNARDERVIARAIWDHTTPARASDWR